MSNYKSVEFSRNYGFWNEAEQEQLCKSKVAIAGVGGDGFQLGYKLAMNGVGHFSIADPEAFETENSNRVFGATSSNDGKNKAEVFRDMVQDIRPDAVVDIYTEGINVDNVKEFMQGADLVLDESELTRLELGTMLARTARNLMIPNLFVMNVGFAGLATSFHPESKSTFERLMGIPKGMPLDEVAEIEVDLSRCLPYLPKYGDLAALIGAQEGAPLPSISQGVDIASAIGSTEAFFHLTSKVSNHRPEPTWAPRLRYMDSYNGESGTIRASRLSHYLGLAAVIGRSAFGINPRASYSSEDRVRRSQ